MRTSLTIVLALVGVATQAQHKPQPMTLDFALTKSDEVQPARWMMWIKDHDLLLADETDKTGGVVDLDASTGKKTHIGTQATLRSLQKAGGTSISQLGTTPDAVDQSGKYLGYIFDQSFFLLNTVTNTFTKTQAPRGSEEFHFSPDGNLLSYVTNHDLYVENTSTGDTKRLTNTGKPNLLNGTMTWVYWEEIYNHDSNASWWSPDSSNLAFFETDESPVPPTTYVNYNTQYVTTTTQCYPKPGHPNPIVRLKIADVKTGSTQTVPVATDQEYIVGVKWTDPRHLLFQTFNRAQAEARFNLYDLDNKELKTIAIDKEKWLDGNMDFDLVDGGASLLFVSPRSGFDHLYKVPITGGTPTPITQGDWQLESNVEGPTAVEHLDKQSGRIFFTGTKDSFLQRQVYTVNTDGSNLKRITTGRGYHYVLVSPDGKYFTDEYSNIETAPITTLFTTEGKRLQIVDAAHPEILKQVVHNDEKFVSFPARDGFQLAAKLRMPSNMQRGKKYPVILHIYGGPESPMVMDRFSFFWALDQLLSDSGYIVLSVDNRTASIRGKKWLNRNRGHLYSTVELNDFVDAARWIKKQPFADANRVGVWGWSGGGGNTLNCLCHSTEFKAGVAGAPYVDPAFLRHFLFRTSLRLAARQSTRLSRRRRLALRQKHAWKITARLGNWRRQRSATA